MANFSSRVKLTVLKGMEALGTTASNLASNAKLKVNEINLENRRREILTNFSLQAFELWQKGVELPAPLAEMLEELSDTEARLSVLRAQKYAKVAGNETAAKEAAPDADVIPCACSVDVTQEADTPEASLETDDLQASQEDASAEEQQDAQDETPSNEAYTTPEDENIHNL